MNLGKPLKVIVIPEHVPAQRPAPAPQTRPAPLIPLPANWPIHQPVEQPNQSGRVTP